MAEVLKSSGYATGCFGKWHLGDQPKFLPNNHGFDYYFGLPYSNDMWPVHGNKDWNFPPLPLIRNGTVVGKVEDGEAQALLCRQFTDEAVEFIRENRDGPFFAYLPHVFLHHPRFARKAFVEKAKNPDKVTGTQIEEVDWSVGQILRTLRDLGIDDNTLVLFASDNGGARGCVNAPLRGGKGSTWEGGLREPTLAWRPSRVPAGSVCNESDESSMFAGSREVYYDGYHRLLGRLSEIVCATQATFKRLTINTHRLQYSRYAVCNLL